MFPSLWWVHPPLLLLNMQPLVQTRLSDLLTLSFFRFPHSLPSKTASFDLYLMLALFTFFKADDNDDDGDCHVVAVYSFMMIFYVLLSSFSPDHSWRCFRLLLFVLQLDVHVMFSNASIVPWKLDIEICSETRVCACFLMSAVVLVRLLRASGSLDNWGNHRIC